MVYFTTEKETQMNIGIIVWSATGHTLSVAETLSKALDASGHKTPLERISVEGDPVKRTENFTLSNAPATDGYDALVFCGFVEAFSLSPVMQKYLSGIHDLGGKKVFCLVTQHFPKPWLGGNNAIKQMKKLVAGKGGTVADTAVINWTAKNRAAQIEQACERATKEVFAK